MRELRLRWRDYRTATGRRPIKEFMENLSSPDRAAVAAAMKDVAENGVRVGRHIVGDLYEVRAIGLKAHYRLIFSQEARFILLAIDIYDKDSQKTPEHIKKRALERLADWRRRGRAA